MLINIYIKSKIVAKDDCHSILAYYQEEYDYQLGMTPNGASCGQGKVTSSAFHRKLFYEYFSKSRISVLSERKMPARCRIAAEFKQKIGILSQLEVLLELYDKCPLKFTQIIT